MPDLRLREYHEDSGALFRREAGWEVPSSYGSLDREVDAVRRAVGIVDASDRSKIRVTGADRLTFLDGLLTADLKVLRPKASAYALVLDEASRVLGDVRVTAFDDAFVLDLEAAQSEGLLGYLRKQIVSDDVALTDLGFCGHVEAHGPLAPALLSAVLGTDVDGLTVDETAEFAVDRHDRGHVTRVNGLAETGFVLWDPGESLALVWEALVRSGAVPVGREALDVLRIEAGRPRFGADMTQGTLALEVAPPGAISLTKGCYRGQEVVARGVSIGQVHRRLVGLRVDGDVPPSHGDAVRSEGEEVGIVTSGCWSPTRGWVIALALLRLDKLRPESRLFIDHDGWDLRAEVHRIPFVPGHA